MSGVSQLKRMPARDFALWLAAFWDAEGCIYVARSGVEMTLCNTHEAIIRTIHKRLGIGSINKLTFSRSNWKPRFNIRLRTIEECETLLNIIGRHLIIKARKVKEIWRRIRQIKAAREAIRARNWRIVELASAGWTHQRIADKFKMNRSGVTMIVHWVRKNGSVPRPRRLKYNEYISLAIDRKNRNRCKFKTLRLAA